MCSFRAIQSHDRIFVPLVVSQKPTTTRRREAVALRTGFAIPHVMMQVSHVVPFGNDFGWDSGRHFTGLLEQSR
jgi:hypothetical protein